MRDKLQAPSQDVEQRDQVEQKDQEETEQQLDTLLETEPFKKVTEAFVTVQTKYICGEKLPLIIGQDVCMSLFSLRGFPDPILWLQTGAYMSQLYDIVDLANIQTAHDSKLGISKPILNIHDAVGYFTALYEEAKKATSLDPQDPLFSYYFVLYRQTGKAFSEKKVKRLYARYIRKNKEHIMPSYLEAYQKALQEISGPYQERVKQMDLWKEKRREYDASFQNYVNAYTDALALQNSAAALLQEIKQLENEILTLKNKRAQLERDIKNNIGDISKLQQEFFAIELSLFNKQKELLDKLPKGKNTAPYAIKISPDVLKQETEEKKQQDIRKNQINYFLHLYEQTEFDADTIFDAANTVLSWVSPGGKFAHRYQHDVVVDKRMLVDYALAIIYNDSHFGTGGLAKRTKNPGNVGNTDEGKILTFSTRKEGLEACLLNVYNRIYWYKVSFPNQEPTIQEIIENRERTTKRGFVRLLWKDVEKREKNGLVGDALWYRIGNHTGENDYRDVPIKDKDGNTVVVKMNPVGAYMTTYPGGRSVALLYERIQKAREYITKLYEISLFEAKLTSSNQQGNQANISPDVASLVIQKNEIYQQLQQLSDETENYQLFRNMLTEQEKKNLHVLSEKDGLLETFLLQQKNGLSLLEREYSTFLEKRRILMEQEMRLVELQMGLNHHYKRIKLLEEQMLFVDSHRTCKEQLSMLKNAVLGKSSPLFFPYQADFSFFPTVLDQDYVSHLKTVENNFLFLQNFQNQYSFPLEEGFYHTGPSKILGEFDEKNIDLLPLSKLAIGIGDSIGQMMRYRGNQVGYRGFPGMLGYPGATTSELVEKMEDIYSSGLKSKYLNSNVSYFVFEGGYNDKGTYKGKQLTPQDTKENIKKAYRIVQKYNTYRKSKGLEPIKFVVCGMYTPLPRAGDFSAQQKAIYDGAQECGDDVLYIDVDAFVKQFNSERFFLPDGLHPTERGAKQLNAYVQYCIMQDRIKQKR